MKIQAAGGGGGRGPSAWKSRLEGGLLADRKSRVGGRGQKILPPEYPFYTGCIGKAYQFFILFSNFILQ